MLHLSDIHLTPSQRLKRDWLAGLAALRPDLVVNTGDNLAHPGSIPALMEAFEGLLRVPGVFVRGSNDYFGPTLRNPFWYLMPDDGTRNVHGTPLPALEMTDRFTHAGWLDLDNATGEPRDRGARRSASSGSTTRTWSTTTWRRSTVERTPAPTSGWGSPTLRTCACSTSSPPTGTT